ncbi:hypothetical protein ACFQ2B_00540 [Streptomyces stramineus]
MTPLRGKTRTRLDHRCDGVRPPGRRPPAGPGNGIGSGKTALLRRLPALAGPRGLRALTTGCAAREQDFPLGVVAGSSTRFPAAGPSTLTSTPARTGPPSSSPTSSSTARTSPC